MSDTTSTGFVQLERPDSVLYVCLSDIVAMSGEGQAWTHKGHRVTTRTIYLRGGFQFYILDTADNMTKVLGR